jgi:uncharacterized protein with ATP-grasp and redox domains
LRIYLDCLTCFFRQALEAARAATDDEYVQRRVLNSVASMIPQIPLDARPPEIAHRVYTLIYQITGNSDPYQEAKAKANQMALALYPYLKQAVADSDDPVLAACKLSIAGNTMDLAPKSNYGDLDSIIRAALTSPLAINDYPEFLKSIKESSHILYLGDNAGEIVFDKLLIEELRQIKQFEISFIVREKPIINDATRHDALSVGLDKVADIVSSGSDAPATILSQCSPEMLRLYRSADTIIAKGQGNYESLSEEQCNIFFLLKVKCLAVARLLHANIGDAILKGPE